MSFRSCGRLSALLLACLSALWPIAHSGPERAEASSGAQVQRLSLVTGDMEASRRMWVEGFGYRVIFDAPGMRGAELAAAYGLDEGARVHFMVLAPPQPASGPYVDLLGVIGQALVPLRTDPPGRPPRPGDHRLVLAVAELAPTVARLQALGLTVVMAPMDLRGAPVEPGAYGRISSPDFEAIVLSPDGTRITLVSTGPDGPENCYLDCPSASGDIGSAP
jgi:catechol 2,3-dioxygenase-like lactoylglutathione lyase family enzyme